MLLSVAGWSSACLCLCCPFSCFLIFRSRGVSLGRRWFTGSCFSFSWWAIFVGSGAKAFFVFCVGGLGSSVPVCVRGFLVFGGFWVFFAHFAWLSSVRLCSFSFVWACVVLVFCVMSCFVLVRVLFPGVPCGSVCSLRLLCCIRPVSRPFWWLVGVLFPVLWLLPRYVSVRLCSRVLLLVLGLVFLWGSWSFVSGFRSRSARWGFFDFGPKFVSMSRVCSRSYPVWGGATFFG